MQISIIIPVLNEANELPGLFERVGKLPESQAEVIFVDGGSTDESLRLIHAAGYRLITSEKGRAKQMNAGAAESRGDTLLFLHADTHLPDQALDLIQKQLSKSELQTFWGRFNVKISGMSWMFAVIAWFINQRSKLTSIVTGDQAIFISQALFQKVGGFPDQPLMEDIELSKRLKSWAKPHALNEKVLTSGRRWEKRGIWRTIFLMWALRFAYWRGVDPATLATRYR